MLAAIACLGESLENQQAGDYWPILRVGEASAQPSTSQGDPLSFPLPQGVLVAWPQDTAGSARPSGTLAPWGYTISQAYPSLNSGQCGQALVAGSWSLGMVVGLALHVRWGWSYRPGPGAQGREGPLHMWVSMAPRGDAPPPLRSDLEGVESGWGDGDPVRRRKGVHVRTGALGGRQPGSVFVGTRAQWWER